MVLGYLLANLWLFDSAVPVSGVAKMIGGAKFNNWGVAAEFLGRWKTQSLALAILLPLEIAARRLKRADGLFYRSAAVAALAALAQYLYYAAFSTWSIQPWYTYLVALERAIILARILYLAAAIGEVPRWRILGFACAAAVGAWMLYRALLWTEQSLPPDAEARAHPLNALLAGVVKQEPQPSFNQISIDMLGDFFPDRGRAPTLIAMGDRSGGLAYWGRDRLAVVQLEGLTLDPNYIRARVGGEGAEYLERRYPIEYLVVDREFIPMVPGPQQEPEYVVAEPIQGRVTTAMVPTFCFPKSAVRYRQAYPTPAGTNTRWAFAFAERVACTSQALELVRNAAASGGLRRLSLPGEFGP